MAEDLTALAQEAINSSRAVQDPDYPQFHLAPPVGRLNDPNGLLVDGDTYHAFYQFGPFHPGRKLVYWGHASSRDLLTWDQHDPAIIPASPYDLNGAYSGGALVLDGDEAARAPAGARFQLFYTGNLKDPQTGARTSTQALVTSPDLVRFTKWPGNPVIERPDGYTAHFRDPQVWRDPDAPGTYRMLVGAQRTDSTGAALLYRSADLASWRLEGELRFPDAHGAFDSLGYMWECPGVVRLPDEATGGEYDVLIFCPQGIRPEGEGYENVFPCVYAVGHLVGNELRDCDGGVREVDRGFEFYAPQVFARHPSRPGPALLMGWAGNADEDDHPSVGSGGWVHTMTAPRQLALRAGRLVQRPAVPLPDDAAELGLGRAPVTGRVRVSELQGCRSWHLELEAASFEAPGAAGDSGRWGLRIGEEPCCVDIDLVASASGTQLVVDRTTSRYAAHGARRRVTLPEGARPRLEVLHDRSITEVLVGDGDIAFTLRSFLPPSASGATVRTDGVLRLQRARAQILERGRRPLVTR